MMLSPHAAHYLHIFPTFLLTEKNIIKLQMLTMSTVNSFTLMFKDKFKQVGLSATDTTLIINTNSVVAMGMGFFVGPLLKILGYRKVAFLGSFFFVAGVIATAWADSLVYFMLSYSVACGKLFQMIFT